MSQERELDHASNQAQVPPQADIELAPGRSSLSAKLEAPETPIVSGLIQRKAERDANGVAEGAGSAIATASSSSGQSLPGDIQRKFETSLGADLSSVRVHTGGESQSAAHAVGAKAYTMGQDIHFGAGHYDPSSSAGEHLLAHEVAHTVQQQGGTSTRQNKLEVSGPQDAAEHEADQAADAMVSGGQATINTSASVVARKPASSDADEMERQANISEKAEVANGPMAEAAMSSLQTVSQARAAMQKVVKANGNLNQRLSAQQAQLAEASSWSSEQANTQKNVTQTQGFIQQNEGVIATLQHIVDLGEGNSQTDGQGNRPGYDMRVKVFTQLATKARQDFARLQGVINAYVGAHSAGAGSEGGELGTAIATGSTTGNLDKVKDQVQAAEKSDPVLANMMSDLKTKLAAYEGGHYPQKINDQLSECASAISKAKNIQANNMLGTVRPDDPDTAKAKAEVDQVNADLTEAKGALDNMATVAKLAVSVMGNPEIGALGEGSSLENINKVTDPASKALGAVPAGVTDQIKTQVASMMTNYKAKIQVAQGHVQQANDNAKREVVRLDTNVLNVAQGDITQSFNKLAEVCADLEAKKQQARDAAKAIADYQKKNRKPGQPDIAGMTRAITEAAAFVTQADAAIQQGDAEQQTAGEMSGARKQVSGDFGADTDKPEAFTGVKQVAKAQKDDAYVDCEPQKPFLLSRNPISFAIWQDNASQNVEVATDQVKQDLDELKGNRAKAAQFEASLKSATGL